MEKKPKIIVILGQTATGKSDFAVDVARKIKELNRNNRLIPQTSQGKVLGEIISADSRQVYKGMNLGTGKITKKEMRGVKHHMIDIISPQKVYSVSQYQKQTINIINRIIKENKIPIICGGTGFYIDSIINNNTFPNVPPNQRLRNKLNKKTKEELFEILEKLDKNRSKSIDKNNKVRLIRAIEIARVLGKVPKVDMAQRLDLSHRGPTSAPLTFLKIGLKLSNEILKERIKDRLLVRIKKGMIKEIKNLHEKNKISWKKLESFGLEYRYISYFLQNKLSKKEMLEKLNTEIWHFAKRQNTWFKRDKSIIWIDPTNPREKLSILEKLNKFINQ